MLRPYPYVLVIAQWPISALWIVGALLGAEIFFRGMRMVAGALDLRRGLHSIAP